MCIGSCLLTISLVLFFLGEIVEKIGLILKDSSTSFKIEIDEQKEKEAIKRKASRSKISS